MCSPAASFIVTKEKVYWSKITDSHIEIRKENSIPENTVEKIESMQTEFKPPNLDYSLPLEQWAYKVDQDLLPNWYVPEYDEKRCREALKEWAATKLKTRVEQGDGNTGHYNSGAWNSGDRNSGDRNSGNRNSGAWNSGDRNSGAWNSGHYNSRDYNSGDYNSGDRNSGAWNSGAWNSGDYNSGDYNSGNHSTGVFCTKEPPLLIFDKKSTMTFEKWRNSEAFELLSRMSLTRWIKEKNMTPEETTNHPEAHYFGGYLRKYEYKDACIKMWSSFTDDEKKTIQKIPNFDAKKFEKITGIKIVKTKTNFFGISKRRLP